MSIHRTITMAMFAAALLAPALAAAQSDGPGRILPIRQRACVADCRQQTGDCLAAARAAARPCFAACDPLVDAARTACAADPESAACHDAAAAARQCLDPCVDGLRPAVRQCLSDGAECRKACPFIGEPPCHAACRADRIECVGAVRAAFTACGADCRDELQAARAACADDADGEACTAARAAARTCLAPCFEAAREGLATCRQELRQCVADCGGDQ